MIDLAKGWIEIHTVPSVQEDLVSRNQSSRADLVDILPYS